MRPHVEFIPSQWLPWQADAIGPLRPGSDARVLSRDDADGACSLIVRYPAGFEHGPEALDADEEFIVLAGSIEVGGVAYGRQGAAQRHARGVRNRLDHSNMDDLFQRGLHEFIQEFIADNARLGDTISKQYLI